VAAECLRESAEELKIADIGCANSLGTQFESEYELAAELLLAIVS
jgi:hypothetical protein